VKLLDLARVALLSFGAAATLTGCGGGVYQAPSGPSQYAFDVRSLEPGSAGHPSSHRNRAHSWMKPGAGQSALLYVSSEMTYDVNVFSYPQGKREGVLTGFDYPQGLCSDPKGDVFIPNDMHGDVIEYAHGGTNPIATIEDSGQSPVSCSFDPTSGTLAVANVTDKSAGPGSVSIYPNATGSPQVVSDPAIYLIYECGFDDKGNLFIDGLTNFPSGGGVFQFAELPKGSSTFKNISLGKKIKVPGGVQWDGSFMDVGDAKTGAIYRTNGGDGKVESTIKLAGTNYDFQFWIQDKTILVPSVYSVKTGFVHYPAGGSAYKAVTVGSPFGATVSVMPK
jgi:hypothetical protein